MNAGMNAGMQVLRDIRAELPAAAELIGVELTMKAGSLSGRILWKRDDGPIPDRPFVTHTVHFTDEGAVLSNGQWDLDDDEAADAWSGLYLI
jgi:hypothetical protein